MTVVYLVVFVGLCALMSWWAGYVLALEDVVGGMRHRFEDWAYRNADMVRGGDDRYLFEWDLLWDRAQMWAPTRGRKGRPAGTGRWSYRGEGALVLNLSGWKVPHRDARSGLLLYAVPTLDGRPLGKVDRWLTVARTKTADLWGCPKCSGWWGGLAAAFVLFAVVEWPFSWPAVVVLHAAGWGLARRIQWGD